MSESASSVGVTAEESNGSPLKDAKDAGKAVTGQVQEAGREIGKRAKLRFHVHPHILRHSTGYYLANRGYDTRLVQDYLGHKNIAHTVRYTRTAAIRFEGLWR